MGSFIIGDKTFQVSYRHGFEFFTYDANLFALIFLRAYTATNSRQGIFLFDLTCRSKKISFCNEFDKSRNVDTYGAAFTTVSVSQAYYEAEYLDGFLGVTAGKLDFKIPYPV